MTRTYRIEPATVRCPECVGTGARDKGLRTMRACALCAGTGTAYTDDVYPEAVPVIGEHNGQPFVLVPIDAP